MLRHCLIPYIHVVIGGMHVEVLPKHAKENDLLDIKCD